MIFSDKYAWLWPLLVLLPMFLSGCVDGPLYRLWYRRQWLEDEQYGPTLYTRLEELEGLRRDVSRMSMADQDQLALRLNQAVVEDPSTIYRAEAARTLGSLATPRAAEGLHRAMGDPEPSVRRAACQAWGQRGDAQSLQMLGQVLRTDDDLDVRITAARELGRFSDSAAVPALGVALDDPNPALQLRAMRSLEEVTGEDFGNHVPAWRQYVRGEPVDRPDPPSMVTRLWNLF